jgi:hypothetical protein
MTAPGQPGQDGRARRRTCGRPVHSSRSGRWSSSRSSSTGNRALTEPHYSREIPARPTRSPSPRIS